MIVLIKCYNFSLGGEDDDEDCYDIMRIHIFIVLNAGVAVTSTKIRRIFQAEDIIKIYLRKSGMLHDALVP
jgi:hypothetical protein